MLWGACIVKYICRNRPDTTSNNADVDRLFQASAVPAACVHFERHVKTLAMDERVPWDEYFMNIAQVVASRSTCPRKFVGAVIVRDRTILSTGYNGSIRGMPHCSEAGHMMENDHCVATIHAEANAIIQAAKNGVMIDGADHLCHRQPVLELLQADRERWHPARGLRRVLSRRADLQRRRTAGRGAGPRAESCHQPTK